MKNFRSSLILALIVLGLFSYIYFIDRGQKSTEEKTREEKNLFVMDAAKVTNLKIISAGGTVGLEKSAGRWQIKEPFAAEAEDSAVEQLVSELQFLQARRVIAFNEITDAPATLKQWGLSPANLKVEFTVGKEKRTLLLGRKTAVSDLVYAKASAADNAPVFLIGTLSRDAVDKKIDDLRSHLIWKSDRAQLKKIALRPPSAANATDYELTRDKETWSLQKPLVARVDGKKLNDWLTQVDALRVKRFIAEDNSNLSQYGLSSPIAQIWLETADPQMSRTLLIGAPATDAPDEVYATRLRSSTIFTLPQSAVNKLLDGLADVRDKHALTFSLKNVTALRLENRGKIMAVKKEKEDWQLASEPALPAEKTKVEVFLQQLVDLPVQTFVKDVVTDWKPFGLDKPVAKITLTLRNDEKEEALELDLGKTDKQQIYARNSSEPFVFALEARWLDGWPKEPTDLRSLQILSVSVEKITEVSLLANGFPVFNYERVGPGKYRTTVAESSVDAGIADEQLRLMSGLRAAKWLGPVQVAFGLSRPRYKLSFKSDAGKSLLIGNDLPDGTKAAQIEGQPEAFALSADDMKILTESPLTKAAASSVPNKPGP